MALMLIVFALRYLTFRSDWKQWPSYWTKLIQQLSLMENRCFWILNPHKGWFWPNVWHLWIKTDRVALICLNFTTPAVRSRTDLTRPVRTQNFNGNLLNTKINPPGMVMARNNSQAADVLSWNSPEQSVDGWIVLLKENLSV